MNGMKAKQQRRQQAANFTQDGLPRNTADWTEDDWRDLHNAIEFAKFKISNRHKGTPMIDTAKDWRMGCRCKPKYLAHVLHGTIGNIVDVLPSGTGGLEDPHGLLVIDVSYPFLILDKADNWITA